MFKCDVCGADLPDGTTECQNCRVHQEPPAKFTNGALVKLAMKEKGIVYYNYVVDSYFNREVNMHIYRLNERIAMPVYREDWLEAVSDEEIDRVNKSGLLRPRKMGGFEYPLDNQEVNK